MSTILKALKQSEARRPREASLPGRLPGGPPGGRRPRRVLGLAIAALLIAGTGAVAWWHWTPGDRRDESRDAARRGIDEVSLPERKSSTEAGEANGGASGATEPAGTPASPAERAPVAGEQDAGEDPGPAADEDPEAPVSTPAGSASEDRADTAAAREEETLDPHALLPRLRHLSDTRREALPKLTLNAHVYAPDPARSFVLINLSRFREGDRLAPGVTVAEIFPGGVVIEDREGRFVLPRP